MEEIKFDETSHLIRINKLFETKYPQFGKLLSSDGKLEIFMIKEIYRDKINSTKNDEEKMVLNMAYEYFIVYNVNDLNSYNENNLRPFKKFEKFSPILLIIINDLAGVKAYFQYKKEDLNKYFDDSKRTCLYLACRCGFKNLVITLLEKGASPEICQENGSIPLHAACYYRFPEIVDLLLQVGSPFNVQNKFGNTPEKESTKDIRTIIEKYKADKGYMFFIDNQLNKKNIKLIFDNMNLVGKRCSLASDEAYNDWHLAWHGTKIEYIPSIIKHGLKKCGEKVGDREIDIRKDWERNNEYPKNERNAIAEAIFTSCSILYSTTRGFAEHFNDNKGQEWVIVLECRLRPDSYKMTTQTQKNYLLNLNEDDKVENQSFNSDDVKVTASWYLTKEFLRTFRDHQALLRKLKEYIS